MAKDGPFFIARNDTPGHPWTNWTYAPPFPGALDDAFGSIVVVVNETTVPEIGCIWALAISVIRSDGTSEGKGSCKDEDAYALSPGHYRLNFTFEHFNRTLLLPPGATPNSFAPGDSIVFGFKSRTSSSAIHPTVFVLAMSPAEPSFVRLSGKAHGP